MSTSDERFAIKSQLNYLCSKNFNNVNRFIRELQKQELLTDEELNDINDINSNAKRLQKVFSFVQSKDGFFETLIACLVQTGNNESANRLENYIVDFHVTEFWQMKNITKIICQDITVIDAWVIIKNEFIENAEDRHQIETMIKDRKSPAEYILKTLELWNTRAFGGTTINNCIRIFRKMEYHSTADCLTKSKQRIFTSTLNCIQQNESNSKNNKNCTTVCVWRANILFAQMKEKIEEYEAERITFTTRLEVLEAEHSKKIQNKAEVIELKKKIADRVSEMNIIHEIIASLQSVYNDKNKSYTQSGNNFWKKLGLASFTGIPGGKAIFLKELNLTNLEIEVSKLLKCLEQCESLETLTLVECDLYLEEQTPEANELLKKKRVQKAGIDSLSHFFPVKQTKNSKKLLRQCISIAHLLNSCSPILAVVCVLTPPDFVKDWWHNPTYMVPRLSLQILWELNKPVRYFCYTSVFSLMVLDDLKNVVRLSLHNLNCATIHEVLDFITNNDLTNIEYIFVSNFENEREGIGESISIKSKRLGIKHEWKTFVLEKQLNNFWKARVPNCSEVANNISRLSFRLKVRQILESLE